MEAKHTLNRRFAMVSPHETTLGSALGTILEKGVNFTRYGKILARWKAEEPSFSNRQCATDGHCLSENANPLNSGHRFGCSVSQTLSSKATRRRDSPFDLVVTALILRLRYDSLLAPRTVLVFQRTSMTK